MPLQRRRQQLPQAGTNVHEFDLFVDVARPATVDGVRRTRAIAGTDGTVGKLFVVLN